MNGLGFSSFLVQYGCDDCLIGNNYLININYNNGEFHDSKKGFCDHFDFIFYSHFYQNSFEFLVEFLCKKCGNKDNAIINLKEFTENAANLHHLCQCGQGDLNLKIILLEDDVKSFDKNQGEKKEENPKKEEEVNIHKSGGIKVVNNLYLSANQMPQKEEKKEDDSFCLFTDNQNNKNMTQNSTKMVENNININNPNYFNNNSNNININNPNYFSNNQNFNPLTQNLKYLSNSNNDQFNNNNNIFINPNNFVNQPYTPVNNNIFNQNYNSINNNNNIQLIFVDNGSNYVISVKKDMIFSSVIRELLNNYPILRDKKINNFISNGIPLIEHETIQNNNLNHGDKIIINNF